MKKFVFLAHGDIDQSPEAREAHMAWWAAMEPHVVDSGNPLFNGRDVSRDGSVVEIADAAGARGYSIIQAESIEDAIALLELSPMHMWFYEAKPM